MNATTGRHHQQRSRTDRPHGALAMAGAVVLLLVGCMPAGAPSTGAPHGSGELPDGWAAGAPPMGEATVVAFYGDSYTRGTGSTGLQARWSTIVSESRGWAEFNPSVDGLGFVSNRDLLPAGDDLVEQILGLEPAPDIVVVTMGLNDNFSMPMRADEIRGAISNDLERLDAELAARIIVVEPFWYTDVRPPSVEQINDWVADAADEIDADHIAGASRWIEGHPEWMAADGIHPNDDGYAEIARRMERALQQLGL